MGLLRRVLEGNGCVTGDPSGVSPLLRQSGQAARQQRHRQDDGQPQTEVPVFGEAAPDRFGLEQLLQQRKGEGAHECTAQVTQATEDDHSQQGSQEVPAHQLGVGTAVLHRKRKPASPAISPTA